MQVCHHFLLQFDLFSKIYFKAVYFPKHAAFLFSGCAKRSYMKHLVYFVFIILLASAICSCRSSQNMERRTYNDREAHYRRQLEIADSLFSALYLTRREVSERLADMKVENTTVYYSAPDSTGKQHPVKVSETKADGKERESTQADTELNATIRRLTNVVDNLNLRVDERLKEHEKVAEMSWWDLHKNKVVAAAGLLALVAAGFLIHRIRK